MAAAEHRVQELLDREQARCSAISRGDLAALSPLLGDDLTHTHATGRTEGKHEYLERLDAAGPRTTSRADLAVRCYGDTALMTGMLRNEFADRTPPEVVELAALQVWVARQGSWQLVAFAASGRGRGGR